MRAVAFTESGGEVRLTELPKPEVGAEDVLVRVHAASINPIDVRISTGRYPWGKYEYPVVPGFDFSGVVESTGSDVARFKEGDEVLGFWSEKRFHRGSWAEYVTIPEHGLLAAKPQHLGFDVAAAMPLAAVTALLAVNGALPLSGEAVLIVGAAGAVGRYAVQLAAAVGATVIATGRPEQSSHLRELGAVETIDYRTDVASAVAEGYRDGIAALIDLANDRDEVTRLSALVRDGGRVASACFGADPEALAERGITATNVITTHAEPGLLEQIVKLVQADRLRIGYDELRPLSEVPAAVKEIASGASRKTVVDVAS